MQVTIEEPGTYRGQCAEFCGIHHWRMPFAVVAEPRHTFEAWVAAPPRGGGASPAVSPAVSQAVSASP
jgi:cytochrome c oxidase subunit 2